MVTKFPNHVALLANLRFIFQSEIQILDFINKRKNPSHRISAKLWTDRFRLGSYTQRGYLAEM
jgi:hypothetical protein